MGLGAAHDDHEHPLRRAGRVLSALAINDAPWDHSYFPVVVSGRTADGRALTGASVRVTPARGVLYETRAFVPVVPFALPSDEHRLRALLPAGRYTIRMTSPRGDYATVVAITPPELRELEGVDGKPFHVRAGTWDEVILKEKAYPRLVIEPGDVVADVGAHVGTFARRALRDGADRVECWEPGWDNAEVLRANLRDRPARVNEAAVVGDDAPTVRLWVDAAGDGDPRRNALHSIKRELPRRLARRVRALRWETELERVRPTVLKVDVEGAEMDYDWRALSPVGPGGSVRRLAVELERARKAYRERALVIRSQLETCGFKLVHETSGWSVTQVWERMS